jgi:hypothetical protein
VCVHIQGNHGRCCQSLSLCILSVYIIHIYINGINKTLWIINASIWPVPLLDAPAVTAVIMSIGTLLFYTYYLHLIIINIIQVDINDTI